MRNTHQEIMHKMNMNNIVQLTSHELLKYYNHHNTKKT